MIFKRHKPTDCFEVSVNGKKVCTIGFHKFGSASVSISRINYPGQTHGAQSEESLDGKPKLDVSGYANGVSSYWVDSRPLCIGDEITVRVIEANVWDEPQRKTEWHTDPQKALSKRYANYQELKREFEATGVQLPDGSLDPEVAKAVRWNLYEQLKAEFEDGK